MLKVSFTWIQIMFLNLPNVIKWGQILKYSPANVTVTIFRNLNIKYPLKKL